MVMLPKFSLLCFDAFLVVLVIITNTRIVSFVYSEKHYQLVLVKVRPFLSDSDLLVIAGLLYQNMWCHTPGGCIFGVVLG